MRLDELVDHYLFDPIRQLRKEIEEDPARRSYALRLPSMEIPADPGTVDADGDGSENMEAESLARRLARAGLKSFARDLRAEGRYRLRLVEDGPHVSRNTRRRRRRKSYIGPGHVTHPRRAGADGAAGGADGAAGGADGAAGGANPAEAAPNPTTDMGANDGIVITGFASGIGRALADVATRRGLHVIGLDIDASAGKRVENATFIPCDLASPRSVDEAAALVGASAVPRLLFLNAGINAFGRFGDLSLDSIDRVARVNLLGHLRLAEALLQTGSLRGLVCLSSLSYWVGYPGAAVYGATKAALAELALLATSELRLAAMAVFPGPTNTRHAAHYSPLSRRAGDTGGDPRTAEAPGAGSAGAKRMDPGILAEKIFSALERGAGRLTPSAGLRAFALFGRLLPGVSRRLMRRALLDKLPPGATLE